MFRCDFFNCSLNHNFYVLYLEVLYSAQVLACLFYIVLVRRHLEVLYECMPI